MKVSVIIVTKIIGGEYLIMKDVASLFETDLRSIFDVKLSFFPAKLILRFLSAAYRKNPSKFLKEILNFIYPYFVKFGNSDEVVIFSNSGSLIPRGKNIVVYIHTPPRIFSDYYDEYRISLKKRSEFVWFIFPIMSKIYNILYTHSLSNARKLICNSETTKDRLKSYYNLDATICSPGVDASLFFNCSNEDFFLAVSRFERAKNFMLILEAFEEFQKKIPKFRLKIAGSVRGEESKRYIEELKAFIKDRKLDVDIILNPSTEQLQVIYSKCFCVLFGAHEEEWGMVLLEAMASEKPIISINSGGPIDIILEGTTGFLVNTKSEMADRMIHLASDRDLAREFGRNGRKRVIDEFSLEAFYNKLTKLINIEELQTK